MIWIIAIGVGIILLLVVFSRTYRRSLDEIEEMIKKNELEKAKNTLQKHLHTERFNALAHFMLARIYSLMMQYDYAILELKSILKYNKFSGKMNKKDVYNLLADAFLKTNKLEEALQQYLTLERSDPEDYHVLLHLGNILFHKKEYEKAIEYFSKAQKANPSGPEAFTGLGMCFFKLNDLVKSSELLTQALQMDNRNTQAHYYMALHHHSQNLFDHAIMEYEQAGRDKNIRLESLYGIAKCYRQKEINTRAIDYYEQTVNLIEQIAEKIRNYTERMNYLANPSLLDMRYELAECYMLDKNYAAAMEQWQEIDAILPEYRDVRQKIKENARYGKDRIQDFLIAKEMDFEKIARYMVQYLNFTLKKLKMNSKEEILMEAVSNSPDFYHGSYCILIRRSFNPPGERELTDFYNEMVKQKIKRGLIISASGIAPTGVKFLMDKPIDLIGKNQVMRLLKKYEQRI